MKFKVIYRKLPVWLRFVLVEAIIILVLILAVVIELRHLADSDWLKIFLYNGDSLTLPVIRQALDSKTPLLWVGSSQLSLFPEGLFYAFSSIMTNSIRSSLVFNAIFNMVILYSLVRWVTSIFKIIPKIYERLFPLGCCLLLILFMILEREPNVNYSSIATLFLFSAYYYGIVLSAIAMLGITLSQLKISLKTKTNIILILVGFLVTTLTVFSDPLFIVAYLLPITVTMLFIFNLTRISLKRILWIIVPQLIGGLVGYEARKPFSQYFGQSLNSHINTYNIPSTLSLFHTVISTYLHNLPGIIEFLLVVGIILFSLLYIFFWVYQKTHHKNTHLDNKLFLLCLFSFIEVVTLIFFSIFSGILTTRYLLPIVIIPMLGLLPLMYTRVIKYYKRFILFASTLFILIISTFGIMSIKYADKLLSTTSYYGNTCLAEALHHKTAYGIGQYWTVRALDVYGQKNEQVFQVNPNFTIFPWQTNLGDYGDKRFSFVIVDKKPTMGAILASDPYLPQDPSKIFSCKNFYIYQYIPGSNGYKELNKVVDQSYILAKNMRSSGNIASYFSKE